MVYSPATGQGGVNRGITEAGLRRAMVRIADNINNAGNLVDAANAPVGGIFIDTDGPTVTFDMLTYTKHQVTLGGNRTLAVANVKTAINQRFQIRLVQDGVGSRTVTWWAGIRWANGVVPILTTTPGKLDWFGFVCTGAGAFDGFPIGGNL